MHRIHPQPVLVIETPPEENPQDAPASAPPTTAPAFRIRILQPSFDLTSKSQSYPGATPPPIKPDSAKQKKDEVNRLSPRRQPIYETVKELKQKVEILDTYTDLLRDKIKANTREIKALKEALKQKSKRDNSPSSRPSRSRRLSDISKNQYLPRFGMNTPYNRTVKVDTTENLSDSRCASVSTAVVEVASASNLNKTEQTRSDQNKTQESTSSCWARCFATPPAPPRQTAATVNNDSKPSKSKHQGFL